jgi:hypothetical protein
VLLYLLENLGRNVPPTAPLHPALTRLREETARKMLSLTLPPNIETKVKDVYSQLLREGAAEREQHSALKKKLRGEKLEVVREKFRSSDLIECTIAIDVAAERRLPVEGDLIELLKDTDEKVGLAAHRALVRLARGTDFGSLARMSVRDQQRRLAKWRHWLALQQTARGDIVSPREAPKGDVVPAAAGAKSRVK